jgi:hypothetical protein
LNHHTAKRTLFASLGNLGSGKYFIAMAAPVSFGSDVVGAVRNVEGACCAESHPGEQPYGQGKENTVAVNFAADE